VRALVEVALLLLVVSLPVLVVVLLVRSGQHRPLTGRRRDAAVRRAKWRPESQVLDGRTVVSVAKSIPAGSERESLGRLVVAEIDAADPEWDVRLSQAMVAARVRAEILNAETRSE
jgi:hypothetical protein